MLSEKGDGKLIKHYTASGEKIMYAHYFKYGKKHQLIISDSTRPVGTTHTIENKKAARHLAKKLNATPYNF
jgi:hypothetical protein